METKHEIRSNKGLGCKDENDFQINIDSLANAVNDMTTFGFNNLRQVMNSVSKLNESFNFSGKNKKHCHCMGLDPYCMTCAPCGPATSSTDMVLEARYAERRRISILIENNQKKASDFSISVTKIIDACGQEITNTEFIAFYPSSGTIPACKCAKVETLVDIKAPLQPGMVYYIEIEIDGACCSNQISLGIWVEQETMIDGMLLCDPCKPKKGKFIEFSECTCGCCENSRKYYLCDDADIIKNPATGTSIFTHGMD